MTNSQAATHESWLVRSSPRALGFSRSNQPVHLQIPEIQYSSPGHLQIPEIQYSLPGHLQTPEMQYSLPRHLQIPETIFIKIQVIFFVVAEYFLK